MRARYAMPQDARDAIGEAAFPWLKLKKYFQLFRTATA